MPEYSFAVHFGSRRTYFNTLPYKDGASAAELAGIAAGLEALTTTAEEGDVATTGGRVVGIHQKIVHIFAKTGRVEPTDITTVNAMGVTGRMSRTAVIGGVSTELTLPCSLVGLNPMFVAPSSLTVDTPATLSNLAKAFFKKYGWVGGGQVTNFIFAKEYLMH